MTSCVVPEPPPLGAGGATCLQPAWELPRSGGAGRPACRLPGLPGGPEGSEALLGDPVSAQRPVSALSAPRNYYEFL